MAFNGLQWPSMAFNGLQDPPGVEVRQSDVVHPLRSIWQVDKVKSWSGQMPRILFEQGVLGWPLQNADVPRHAPATSNGILNCRKLRLKSTKAAITEAKAEI